MAYMRPDSLAEAVSALSASSYVVLAGGTDLFPATAKAALDGDILDLGQISDLNGISQTDDGWRIGAMTSWSTIAKQDLPTAFGALQQAAIEVGSVQIQNRATIGGNICNASPAADGVPALLVLDAEVELMTAQGSRREKLANFITGNRRTLLQKGEILTHIHIKNSATNGASHFIKLGARKYLVISIAMLAARFEIADGLITKAALAVGACSAVAQRLSQLENDLIGMKITDDFSTMISEQHLADLSPIDDIRANKEYRMQVVPELIAMALKKQAETGL